MTLPDIAAMGHRIRFARHGLGLSQKALAGKLGVSQHYFSDLERDVKIPSERLLRAIAYSADVPVAWLAYGNLGTDVLRPGGQVPAEQDLDDLLARIRELELAVLGLKTKINRQRIAAVTEEPT